MTGVQFRDMKPSVCVRRLFHPRPYGARLLAAVHEAAVQQVRVVHVEAAPEPEHEPADLVECYDADADGSINQQEWPAAIEDRGNDLLDSYGLYVISLARSYS